MNPYDPVHRDRLFRAYSTSYRSKEPFRNLNRALIEEYAGSGYGNRGPQFEIIINLMNQAVDAYTMSLVANRPRIIVSTEYPDLTYFARQFETAVNNLIGEIGIEFTLRRWVLDAFFSIGIIKIHLADSAPVMIEQDIWFDPGTPAASNVCLDNWVHDMSATKWTEVKFAGDAYRISFEDLKRGDVYDQNAVKDLQPTSKMGASMDADRVARISNGSEVDQDEFEPMIDLADVWVPRDGKIYTFAVDNFYTMQLKGLPVAVMDWNGPEHGPYHLLGFNDVPDNIMPTSPASHLASMSRLVNSLARKQKKRAMSQKRVHTYNRDNKKDAQRVRNAADDEWIDVEDPKEVGEVLVGGIDPQTHAFMLGVIDMYDRAAGNLTAMMGLGAQADTVGQEQLIHSAVSKKEANMQYRVIDGATRVIRDLGHLLWNDKFRVMRAKVPVESLDGYYVDMTWTPEDREGDFLDYNFCMDLYSMPYQSPGQRLQAINSLVTQIYAPMMQGIMAQGGQFNFAKYNDIIATLMNEPRVKQLIEFAHMLPEDQRPPQGMEGSRMPAATNRTYTRRNIPTGGTVAGRSQVQQQMWMNAATPQQTGSMAHSPA